MAGSGLLPSAPQVAAGMLVVGALGLGWLVLWRLVLCRIPVVRALCNLPQLPQPVSPDVKNR